MSLYYVPLRVSVIRPVKGLDPIFNKYDNPFDKRVHLEAALVEASTPEKASEIAQNNIMRTESVPLIEWIGEPYVFDEKARRRSAIEMLGLLIQKIDVQEDPQGVARIEKKIAKHVDWLSAHERSSTDQRTKPAEGFSQSDCHTGAQ